MNTVFLIAEELKAFEVQVDVKFYVILSLLAVATIVLCCLFARSEKFRIRKQIESGEIKKEEYIQPVIIDVKEKKD